MNNVDRSRLYDISDDFFALQGSAIMKLTAQAAKDVCLQAIDYGILIGKIEGGFWRASRFEARLDCIWDGVSAPVSLEEARHQNLKAAAFVDSWAIQHNAFIITTLLILGSERC